MTTTTNDGPSRPLLMVRGTQARDEITTCTAATIESQPLLPHAPVGTADFTAKSRASSANDRSTSLLLQLHQVVDHLTATYDRSWRRFIPRAPFTTVTPADRFRGDAAMGEAKGRPPVGPPQKMQYVNSVYLSRRSPRTNYLLTTCSLFFLILATMYLAYGLVISFFSSVGTSLVTESGVGRLPALGWNSWNAYHCDITESQFITAAEKLVALGLKVRPLSNILIFPRPAY